ncbi:hypothetical protein K439DRAFT_1334077, partial [Ramaria rubella]
NTLSSPVYPKLHYSDNSSTHSLILVRKCLATNTWEIIDIDSGDIMAIRLKTPSGNILLFNIYNDNIHSNSLNVL